MNISEEAEKRYGKPVDAENDVQIALSLGFKAGAVWALREAAETVALIFPGDAVTPANVGGWVLGKRDAENVVRALAGGAEK